MDNLILAISFAAVMLITVSCYVIKAVIIYNTKNNNCPFKYACMKYNEVETKNAADRINKLLAENQSSK